MTLPRHLPRFQPRLHKRGGRPKTAKPANFVKLVAVSRNSCSDDSSLAVKWSCSDMSQHPRRQEKRNVHEIQGIARIAQLINRGKSSKNASDNIAQIEDHVYSPNRVLLCTTSETRPTRPLILRFAPDRTGVKPDGDPPAVLPHRESL